MREEKIRKSKHWNKQGDDKGKYNLPKETSSQKEDSISFLIAQVESGGKENSHHPS